jgi:transposase
MLVMGLPALILMHGPQQINLVLVLTRDELVPVQVVKTSFLRSQLLMAYPAPMEPPAVLPPDIWERTPPEAQAYIRALEVRVAALEGGLQALQEQLQQTAQHASRPPSNDSRQPQRQRRSQSKHRHGGQPGHPGHTRALLAVEAVDEIVVLKPEQCPGCSAPLSGEDPMPWRHQVIELPPIQPVVTEYQWHQLMCLTCGTVTRAPRPPGVPSGTYAPRVHATVALYTGVYRLSKRMTQQMMREVFGVSISVGAIRPLEQTMTAAVTAPIEEARTYVQEQAVAHLDETNWRQGNKHAW